MNKTSRKTAKGTGNMNLWILPYANLMTIVMIFFLLLYVLSNFADSITAEKIFIQIERSLGGKTGEKEKMVNAASDIQDYLSDRGLKKLANVEMKAQKIRLVMQAPILFSLGSADLNPAAYPLLEELGTILKRIPNKITVEGHTDDLPVSAGGKYGSNLELSGARAFNVMHFMVQKSGLDPKRCVTLGCGENFPVKPNDTPENRTYNRRVELTIEK